MLLPITASGYYICLLPLFLSFFFPLVLGVLQGNSKDFSFVFEAHLTFILSGLSFAENF